MKCPVCNERNCAKYREIDKVKIFQCSNCLCGFVSPKTLRKNTKEIYQFEEYKTREQQFRNRYGKTLHLIQKYAHGKKVLEVGGGFGLLSRLLSDAGYEVDMLEPFVNSPYTDKTSIRVIKKRFEDFAESTKSTYDVIIMYDMLEHVDDCKLAVADLGKLLKQNGIVLIQTPNYLSLMAKIVRHWSWWMVEDHRLFFSQRSLKLLFSKMKWQELCYSTYEEWNDFKKNLDGSFSHRIIKYCSLLLFIPTYFILRQILWGFGWGGLHLAIWRKK